YDAVDAAGAARAAALSRTDARRHPCGVLRSRADRLARLRLDPEPARRDGGPDSRHAERAARGALVRRWRRADPTGLRRPRPPGLPQLGRENLTPPRCSCRNARLREPFHPTMVSVSLALLCAGPGIAVAQRIELEGAELRATAALRAVRRRQPQVLSAVRGRR